MIRFCQSGDLDAICRIAKAAWEKIFDHLEDAYGKDLYNMVNPDCRNSKTPWLHNFFCQSPGLDICSRTQWQSGGIYLYNNEQPKQSSQYNQQCR